MEVFMAGQFPDAQWLADFATKLNQDSRYADVAKNWEGDLAFNIEPGGTLTEPAILYLDLWHGKCRKAEIVPNLSAIQPKFVLTAPYDNFLRILQGKLDPMQAMMTRKLKVQGNMGYMMRNVPVVLDFVRCAKEITAAD